MDQANRRAASGNVVPLAQFSSESIPTKQSVLAQAAAVDTLLQSNSGGSISDALPALVTSCAADLIVCGEYLRSAGLIATLIRVGGVSPGSDEWVTASITRARALLAHGNAAETMVEVTALRECLKAGAEIDAERLALIQVLEGGALWRSSRYPDSVRLLRELLDELSRRPPSFAWVLCALELHGACLHIGDATSAWDAANEALVISTRIGDRYRQAIAHMHLGALARRQARASLALEHFERAETTFAAIGNSPMLRSCANSRALLYLKKGRLSEALSVATAVAIDAVSDNARSVGSVAELVRASALMQMGRFQESLEAIEQAKELETARPLSRLLILALEYEGDLALEQGKIAGALATFQAALNAARIVGPRGDLVAELKRRIGECQLLSAGLSNDEAKQLEDCVEVLMQDGEQFEAAACHRVLALGRARRGDHAGARAAFEAGFDAQDATGLPFEWGKLWLSYGEWLAADSSGSYRNLSAAREAVIAAIDHFERMGAEYRLNQARERLAALDETMRLEGEAYAPTHGKVRPARRPRQSAEQLRRSQWALDTYGLVTRSAPLLDMLHEVARVSASDLPVLVLGESGTGKELIAQGVHRLSGRTGEFLAINCSAVPEAMLEGEFFGYMKGAFTNAMMDKPGLFEVAHEGTVFLDEIGEMSPDLQAKLLRFLETGVVRRVGATRDQKVDTRIVAATNRERSALQSGSGFRSDLYYRLAHAVYELPPLRARGDDLDLLVDHFLGVFNLANDKRTRFSPAARAKMLQHSWPGNVRELQAVVHKLVVAAGNDATFTPRDLPPMESAETGANFEGETNANERKRIIAALEQARFVKTDAALSLRISRTTLLSKMKRLGIEG